MTEILSSEEITMSSVTATYDLDTSSKICNESMSEDNNVNNAQAKGSYDDYHPISIVKKIRNRSKIFNDSEDEQEGVNIHNDTLQSTSNVSSDSDDYTNLIKQRSGKSRLKKIKSDESESDSSNIHEKENKLINDRGELQKRIIKKRNKLKEKFQNLNAKDKQEETKGESLTYQNNIIENESPGSSDDEITSINEIKQKIKERTNTLKLSICDPDTSEDESNQVRSVRKPKQIQKRMKLTSPKPQKMSAKQALENMQKIKSESNRMLREKEVTLPYHRPKTLSLKDIMSRRKPAVSTDGKILPIKMNEEQLKQYVLQLEQRQKEMIELCKSDTDEEETEVLDDMQQSDHSAVQSSLLVPELTDQGSESVALANCDSSLIISDNGVNSKDEIDATKSDSFLKPIEQSIAIINTSHNNLEVIEQKEDKSQTTELDESNESLQNNSEEMELTYNDSIETQNEEDNSLKEINIIKNNLPEENESGVAIQSSSSNLDTNTTSFDTNDFDVLNGVQNDNLTEKDSQLISLHYDTKLNDSETYNTNTKVMPSEINNISHKFPNHKGMDIKNVEENPFSDDDIEMEDLNMDDIDSIIENASTAKDNVSDTEFKSHGYGKQDTLSLKSKPKLMGKPGMVIDLDDSTDTCPKKLTGVELLKERFTFFAKLKTPEELEREREKRQKPGTQHIKLKQELEEKIAEQRSLEWAKRLENENQPQKEVDAVVGNISDVEDDIDKIEAKLEEEQGDSISSPSESEEEIEDDVLIEDKPRKKNPLFEDEAEESDVDETVKSNDEIENDADIYEHNSVENEDLSDDEESSESEDEEESKPKRGRILKAFEDSDDEEANNKINESEQAKAEIIKDGIDKIRSQTDMADTTTPIDVTNNPEKLRTHINDNISESQDDDLQLAQIPKTNSEELFTSQESIVHNKIVQSVNDGSDADLGSQTFSILNHDTVVKNVLGIELSSQKNSSGISETQLLDDNLDAIVSMCPSLPLKCIEFNPPSMQSQNSQSQVIGDDILDMCTGKFYDNQLVSQTDDNAANASIDISQEYTPDVEEDEKNDETEKRESNILKSVLDELNDTEVKSSKPLKYFSNGISKNNVNNAQIKRKLIIDSDDDVTEAIEDNKDKKRRKKRKKLEKRALQISDDEECSEQENEDIMPENDEVENDNEERLVEYDSEENEIEVKLQPKKKRKAVDFFEQEAELTSEDEWAGSGDEDEAGLDCMEREAGDDDTFHQGALQAELGQIHMRNVLDQDKREVRLIQELLFEDDLGGGGRQRKFRWRNADGEEVTGTTSNELTDTQEEEFESEEQWRKQRHEREMFLRQMKSEEESENVLDVSINRSTIIKANLLSRTMSSIIEENKQAPAGTVQSSAVPDKKITKDIPSPKKPFSVFQQNYHGSLLTRGRGALARLAALATPLAVDDEAQKIGLIAASSKRNFVFAAITPKDETKVPKRKADTDIGTPRLLKKMRKESNNQLRKSLLDHLKS
ncbi:unnamed protein product [Diatraea saccharalis]|uniref:Claspin n=1 Tax=Diatraea saccharalis TaxID=40085 RepID=A0A9P0C512_9NEOP|nr:unnamed protein product [Diatraea saccharalis]